MLVRLHLYDSYIYLSIVLNLYRTKVVETHLDL